MLKSAARHILGVLPSAVQQSIRQKFHDGRMRRLRHIFAKIGAVDIPVADFNHLLHHLRGQALDRLPKGAKHFLSVGCAGTWYFHWIEEKCQPQRHTGIEFYAPRPSDLPANVEWIANTAGNMEALPDGTADLLFSGQNIEHLWPEDIGNFLLESHRVLQEGGLLVIDSPNRRVTALLQWSHPEHTIELDAQEMEELLGLAGFDVELREGLWLCETDTGTVLPVGELTSRGPWPLERRVAQARANVESSFVWWVQARRSKRQPQAALLRERIQQIYSVAWPERLNRLKTMIGRPVMRNGQTWFDSEGRAGTLMYGPYTAMPPGRHEVSLTLESPGQLTPSHPVAVVQVTAANGATVLARQEIPGTLATAGEFVVPLAFDLAQTTFSVEFVVMAFEGVRLNVKKAVSLKSEPSPA